MCLLFLVCFDVLKHDMCSHLRHVCPVFPVSGQLSCLCYASKFRSCSTCGRLPFLEIFRRMLRTEVHPSLAMVVSERLKTLLDPNPSEKRHFSCMTLVVYLGHGIFHPVRVRSSILVEIIFWESDLNPFATGNPFLGEKSLGFSRGRGLGALNGLSSQI